MDIGKAIKTCRAQRGFTQTDLADMVGLSCSGLSLIECGKRNIKLSMLNNIASTLNVPVSIIVFLASSENELAPLPVDLCEKLAHVTLQLIGESNG